MPLRKFFKYSLLTDRNNKVVEFNEEIVFNYRLSQKSDPHYLFVNVNIVDIFALEKVNTTNQRVFK